MKQSPDESYLERAKNLTAEESERLLSRMRGKLERRFETSKLTPLEAIAMQLEREDKALAEWRARFAEIKQKDKKK
jgi:hypothetical protein